MKTKQDKFWKTTTISTKQYPTNMKLQQKCIKSHSISSEITLRQSVKLSWVIYGWWHRNTGSDHWVALWWLRENQNKWPKTTNQLITHLNWNYISSFYAFIEGPQYCKIKVMWEGQKNLRKIFLLDLTLPSKGQI